MNTTIILLFFIITMILFKLYLILDIKKNDNLEKYNIEIDHNPEKQDQENIRFIEIIKAEDKIMLNEILKKYYKINIEECTIKKFKGNCNHYCNTIKANEDLHYIKSNYINSYMFDPYIVRLGEYHTIFHIYIYLCKECKTVYYSLEMKHRENFRY